MMKWLKKSARARRLTAATLCCGIVAALTSDALCADLTRYIQRDKETGEYVEGTRSGKILNFSKTSVEFEYVSSGETKKYDIPSEQILWLQFDDEPMTLATARVESQVGNYEAALDIINAIDEELKDELIATELEWARCSATMSLALADSVDGSKKLEDAIKIMKIFVEKATEHYRFYEANALLGDALIRTKEFNDAKKYYQTLADASSAAMRARGEVGLAQVAFDEKNLDEARELFAKVAESKELDSVLDGLNARVNARIGLARVLTAQGDTTEALKTLDALLAETPNSATRQQAIVYNALGDVYVAANKPREAIVAYLHVDLLYPAARGERVKALRALAPLWEQVGRRDRAAETRTILLERFNVELDE